MKRTLLLISVLLTFGVISAHVELDQVNNFEVETKQGWSLTDASLNVPDTKLQNAEFTISPNPGTDKLNIKLPVFNAETKIEVFDVLGKRIYTGVIPQLESSIDVSNWRNGIYLVKVSTDKTTQTKRFIKQ